MGRLEILWVGGCGIDSSTPLIEQMTVQCILVEYITWCFSMVLGSGFLIRLLVHVTVRESV